MFILTAVFKDFSSIFVGRKPWYECVHETKRLHSQNEGLSYILEKGFYLVINFDG